MGTLHGLFIGVERYKSPKLKPVHHAEKDAKDIRDAFIALGYSPEALELLLTDDATCATVEYKLKRVIRGADEDDIVLIFYAGHGLFSHGRNYITCVDSQLDDIPGTCVPLEFILDEFKGSRSPRSMLFLDACHSGVEINDNTRDTLSKMSDEEAEAFFKAAEYRVGFASCRADEISYTSHQLQNGIWSHFLAKALRGEAAEVLDKNNRITSSSLQDYLAIHVPRRAKKENGASASQTPQAFGRSSSTFEIADLSNMLASQKEAQIAAATARAAEIRDIHLTGTEGGALKRMVGWKSGWKLPQDSEDYSRKFVERACEQMLDEHSEALFQRINECFGYGVDDSNRHFDIPYASIVTPDFTLDMTCTLDEDDLSCYKLTYDLNHIANPSILENEAFNDLLADIFDTVTFEFKERVEIVDLARTLEKEPGFKLRVPSSRKYFDFTFAGVPGNFVMRPDQLECTFAQNASPKETLLTFNKVRGALAQSKLLPLLQ